MVDMYEANEKIGLSVREAGWLLQKTESQVRRLLRRGELWYAVSERKIDPESVDGLIESEFSRTMMRWLLAGLLVATKPESRYGRPAPLLDALQPLMLASPALVHDERTGRSEIVPRLADHLQSSDAKDDGT